MENNPIHSDRPDRKLGDEWEDWSGDLDESVAYEETAGLFTLFAALALLLILAGLGFVLFMIEPRLAQVHPSLVWGARFLAAMLVLGSAGLGIMVAASALTGKNLLVRTSMGQAAAARILPIVLVISRKLGIPRDRIGNSFVRFSNAVVRASHHPGHGKTIILIPRCLKPEVRKEVLDMGARSGVGVFTATGGGEARQIIRRERPSGVIGVACERDLISGISDVAPRIATLGVANKRPEGPCKNTLVDLDELRAAIETFTGVALER
jgi:uncharacterized protein